MPKREPKPPAPRAEAAGEPRHASGQRVTHRLFPPAFGFFLGLTLLKFGNPPIMEGFISAPTNIYEFVLATPWPIRWAYTLLVAVAVLGGFCWQLKLTIPRWLALLPLAWVGWQVVAAANTVDAQLTRLTVPHLVACTVCFYLGLFALPRCANVRGFWTGLITGLVLVIASGLQQRFGGLEETRRYFMTYVYPTLESIPPDYMKKMTSNRIFATLFYPNSLAASMILLLPAVSVCVYQRAARRFTPAAQGFLAGLVALAGLGCLYWSGSKGGWLILLLVLVVGFLHWQRVPARLRLIAILLIVAGGLAGFFWTYSAFFKRGAPSVGARFDYWKAAVQNTARHPIVGSGPGTFAVPYKELKAPESEMSRLVHNDYLQQASDAGLPSMLLFTVFVAAALWQGYLRARPGDADRDFGDAAAQVRFAVWLGLCGWAAHSLIDFDLYVPAIAWIALALTGWLLSHSRPLTSPQAAVSAPTSQKHPVQ